MISLLLTLAGYFKSRHQVCSFSCLVLMGMNLVKKQTLFLLTLGRTRGGWELPNPLRFF